MKILDLLTGTFLRFVPLSGYKSTVNLQIKIYRKLKQRKNLQSAVNEEHILNEVLDTRRRLSLNEMGADLYYKELISIPHKTLEQVIRAIIEWEYFSGFEASKRRSRNKVPLSFIEKYRQEIGNYIQEKVKGLD